MNKHENYRRTVLFDTPEYIPMNFHVNTAVWNAYDQNQLCDLLENHPLLFPDFRRPELPFQPEYYLNARAGEPYTDPWKCVWTTDCDGITGVVSEHPLADWADFPAYTAPDPDETDGTYPLNLKSRRRYAEECRRLGGLVGAGLPHGHTWLRLQDIRGYADALCDLACDDPNIIRLLKLIEDFNVRVVENLLTIKPDVMCFAEDLGMQHGPMISPELFRRYIKPVYQRMMRKALDQGCMIHMHSDGDIKLLIDDLIGSGVQILNLQDQVNGVEWIAGNLAQKLCIELDVDRQDVTVFGSPAEIDALIRKEVSLLGSKRGGLMLVYGFYPGTPIRNAAAVMDAMERYSTYFS